MFKIPLLRFYSSSSWAACMYDKPNELTLVHDLMLRTEICGLFPWGNREKTKGMFDHYPHIIIDLVRCLLLSSSSHSFLGQLRHYVLSRTHYTCRSSAVAARASIARFAPTFLNGITMFSKILWTYGSHCNVSSPFVSLTCWRLILGLDSHASILLKGEILGCAHNVFGTLVRSPSSIVPTLDRSWSFNWLW